MSLEGATALVIGASGGIGRAAALALARAGAEVVVSGRGGPLLEEVAGACGGRTLPLDLGDTDAVGETACRLLGELGSSPAVLVNAAGVFQLAPIEETTIESFDRHYDVNARGAFLLLRAFLPGMLRAGKGRIINVGSVAGRIGLPGNAAYSASKYALRGLHDVLLAETKGSGVSATLIESGAVDTPVWDPIDPDADPELPDRSGMLRPEDVAEAILFAATRPASVRIPYLPVYPC